MVRNPLPSSDESRSEPRVAAFHLTDSRQLVVNPRWCLYGEANPGNVSSQWQESGIYPKSRSRALLPAGDVPGFLPITMR